MLERPPKELALAETVKAIKWICELIEYKISIASIKLVDDYVSFYFPRPGCRAAHRTSFDFPKVCKTSTWGIYFIRTTANANIVSAKHGIDLRQEKPASAKR